MNDARIRPFRLSVQAFEAQSGPQWTGLARQAGDLGYSTLFTTDHYFGPRSMEAFAPVVARLAGR